MKRREAWNGGVKCEGYRGILCLQGGRGGGRGAKQVEAGGALLGSGLGDHLNDKTDKPDRQEVQPG